MRYTITIFVVLGLVCTAQIIGNYYISKSPCIQKDTVFLHDTVSVDTVSIDTSSYHWSDEFSDKDLRELVRDENLVPKELK